MKSVQIKKRYGGKAVVEINESTPAPNDACSRKVLVIPKAASMNPTDRKVREEYFKQTTLLQFPLTLRVETVIEKKPQRDSREKISKLRLDE